MQAGPIPKDLCYIEGEDFYNYINDMKITQEHAKINRYTIASQILQHMNLHEIEIFDTIHNYIDTDNMILRKGSISAQAKKLVMTFPVITSNTMDPKIANMATASILGSRGVR